MTEAIKTQTVDLTERSQTLGTLTDAGFNRTAFLDLGDEATGLANAQRAGDQFLEEHRYPVKRRERRP